MLKKLDVAVFETIRAFTEGAFEPGVTTLTLADKALGLAPSGGYLTDVDLATIGELSEDIATGVIVVSRAPTGELMPPPAVEVSATVRVTWDGRECTYAGDSATFPGGAAVRFDFVNLSSQEAMLGIFRFEPDFFAPLQAPAKPMNANSGYVVLSPGRYEVNCFAVLGDFSSRVSGATLTAQASG